MTAQGQILLKWRGWLSESEEFHLGSRIFSQIACEGDTKIKECAQNVAENQLTVPIAPTDWKL